MKADKWFYGVRNKIARLCGEFDSCAAIEGAKLTKDERKKYQEPLMKFLKMADEDIKNH